MVFVNEKKFACEACIKGHRSSSCLHSKRPLFEVKKKGRPVSQCFKCRELRQEKRVHSKCTCTPRQPVVDKVPIPAARPDKKPRRFMPSTPTLPNGITDALQLSASSPPDFRRTVYSLLNPCHCKSITQCTCKKTPSIAGPSFCADVVEDSGLQTLAKAAMLFLDPSVQDSPSEPTLDPPPRSCCTSKRTAVPPHAVPPAHLDLPPIMGPIASTSVPDFPTIPPLSSFESIAGSGCTCGLHCTCPGCIEHRTPRYVETNHKDCSEGCGHCVDRTAGIELPSQDTPTLGESLVDAFFSRAAALPDPLVDHQTNLKTGNDAIYPRYSLLGRSTDEAGERDVTVASCKEA